MFRAGRAFPSPELFTAVIETEFARNPLSGSRPPGSAATRVDGHLVSVREDQAPVIERHRPPMRRRLLVPTTAGFGQRPVIFNDLPDHVGRFLVLSEFTFCGEQFGAEVVAVQR